MARLLKNTYLKVSSHSKFCSYATKTNPYKEILKTLRLWEQELKSKNRNSLGNTNEYLFEHSISQTERTLNIHENLHLNEDITTDSTFERTINQANERYCDNTLSKGFNIREQELENESTNFYPRDEEILIFTAEHSPNKIMHSNRLKLLNELANGTYGQEIIKGIEHPKERTTKKGPSKAKRKSKKSTAKSSSLFEKEEIKNLSNEHISNNLLPVNESINLHSDHNPCENSNLINSPLTHSEERTTDKSTNKISLTSEKKSKSSSVKSKKSATKLTVDGKDLKKESKLKFAIQSLKCSIEACINTNKVDQAHKEFQYLNEKKKQYLNVDLYNLVIAGWARLGQLDKVKQLFSLMQKNNIVPNVMSYAGYLEAIATSKCMDVAEISEVVNKMKAQGYLPTEILQKCVFIGDQREKVLQVLGFVERDLHSPLYVPDDAYTCKLLEKLNDKNYEKEESHFNYCFQSEDIPNISATQMEIESLSSIKIKSVNAVTQINDKIQKSRDYINALEKQWRNVLTKKIDEFKTPRNERQGHILKPERGAIYTYLSLIDTEVLVNLLLQESRMLAETAEFYSPNIKSLYGELGLKVMKQYFMSLNKKNGVTDKVHFIYQKYLHYLMDPDLCDKYLPREYWEFLKSKYSEGPTIDVSNVCWPYSLIVYMGYIMYDLMSKTIYFNPNHIQKNFNVKYNIPAFHVIYEFSDLKLYKQVRTNDLFAKLYRDAKLEYLEFDVSLVPMLSPPHPWVQYDSGGLLITKVPFIRFPEQASSMENYYYSKVKPNQLNACFDSLNSLSLCPWIINKPILDIVTKIFQEGGSEELDIPLNPNNFKIDSKLISGESNESLKASRARAFRDYEKKKGEMTSLWFDCLYKLSIANHFKDKTFWFPHNLDFRGRVYPTPPHFNHLGSDLSRSILLFAHGKPLGKKGLDWLKTHLINLTGFKKRASHAERLIYANEILPEIFDSADNPFGGNRWWISSDKPLQTLACCKEVAAAVRHPNPEEYISHFPIHQDGSCNGLQHYAALGRDELGAIEVNLHPSSSPQDVYSGVAGLVEKERTKNAEEGLEIAQALKYFITRKVVKQTVMTFVYGVTPYGARLQVLKQLKDVPEFPERYQHEAASYLMKKIFMSIKEMFTATRKIQDWFTQCAEEITRVTGKPVQWVTPLGLPVIQPYYKQTTVRNSKFCLSKCTEDNLLYKSSYEPYEMPNVRKQKNAFAPNFIHSLDSSHMMLTSLLCHRKSITFVSVHDCYWTHAVTVETMNRICREQFVALHSEPILENLSAFFLEKFASIPEKNDLTKKQIKERKKLQATLSAVPEKGTFDLNKVLNSEYFFS